ncbi:flavodoxin [Clostridium beijerinckii]|jgi:flavodoxin, short chain|uniref:Flavodoxin n=2 Tax=Clostridium beijerinckii TaxID=1520 RepID=A0AAE2UXB3_CLOBE|nr:flavodoxin [Clostridium beijerinckii]ABR34568.1 flavodoxin [Clostridium beijerinckii NCIMB 8052]AIU04295.1 flavodoxin [Clostridium beijerinckii ATCC 35702]MBF7810804.1 flavodoxin [Clostridium beijerinckii]NRT24091.1 flavodoxin short chain [Clostridium beijerinckii]NRT68325.1 flavodoxin short chain [Clostridium beijerinckii]
MKIVYWSGTGNTEKMAELIAKGIIESGKDVNTINVSDVNIDELLNEDILILGCSAMGDEVLEESEFEPFIEEISTKVSGKKVALFGSYGWGDGKWMRDFEERMNAYGCVVVETPLIVQNEPDEAEQDCIDFGKKIANI